MNDQPPGPVPESPKPAVRGALPPPPPGPNKWIWALRDFSERLEETFRACRGAAANGIEPNRALAGAFHGFVAGPPKMPYPVEECVLEDVRNAMIRVYGEEHNFGAGRRRHRRDLED